MSRQYDAKHEALKAYPKDTDAGVALFLLVLGVTETDFRYEEGVPAVEYIYGAARSQPIPEGAEK